MACLDENTLAALMGGDLAGPRLDEVHAHLATCSECTRLVATLAKGVHADQERLSFADTLSRPDGGGPAADANPNLERIGRYVVFEQLGSGGMGRVLAAFDPVLERRVALKLVKARSTGSEEVKARLLREGKAIAQLNHPNIVSIFDMGVSDGEVYVAMELVDGGSLKGWLAARPRGWRDVLSVYLDAGKGLAAAHRAGLVHRDFKPDNVLIGSDGRVRVSDFGLSTSLQREESGGAAIVDPKLTQTGALLGTPAYMSPEQWEGQPADALSDQFSFCLSLWEGLSGQRPFEAITRRPSWKRVEPTAMQGLPPTIRAALDRGLSLEPRHRFPSMEALLHVLEFLDAVVPPAPAPSRRSPLTAVVLAAVVAIVALGAWRWSRSVPEPVVVLTQPVVIDAGVTQAAAPAAMERALPLAGGSAVRVEEAPVVVTRPSPPKRPTTRIPAPNPLPTTPPKRPADGKGIIPTYPEE